MHLLGTVRRKQRDGRPDRLIHQNFGIQGNTMLWVKRFFFRINALA